MTDIVLEFEQAIRAGDSPKVEDLLKQHRILNGQAFIRRRGNGTWYTTSALETAISSGHLEIVKLLVSAGAKADEWALQAPGSPEILEFLIENGAEIGLKGHSSGHFLVLRYAYNTQLSEAILKVLLDKGVDPNHTHHNGLTPLHQAANNSWGAQGYSKPTPNFDPDLGRRKIELLLAYGADPNRHLYREDRSNCPHYKGGETPLHLAAAWGTEAWVRALIAGGADKNRTNHFGETALDYAKYHKNEPCVELLA